MIAKREKTITHVPIESLSILGYSSWFLVSALILITTPFPSKINIATPMCPKTPPRLNTLISPEADSPDATNPKQYPNMLMIPIKATPIPAILR